MDGFRRPPSPISPHDSNAFKWIEECVHRIFDRPTTPSLMVAGTDTYHYWDLSPNIYRFSPVELAIEEAKMFHGVNEKISVNALAKMVLFYSTLIVRSS
jgi:carboxypeptidase PM20D1